MAIENVGIRNQQVRDELGSEPSVQNIAKLNDEEIGVQAGPSKATANNIGCSWIVGSSTNGIVGTNLGTQNGQQQVVGSCGRTTSVVAVINPNNLFHEYFNLTEYQDSNATNTADWNGSLSRLAMTSDTDQGQSYNTVANSSSVALADGTITRARVTATETKFGNDVIRYFLSADGGTTYQEFTLDTQANFTITGTDLRFRIFFSGNGANETYIDDLHIDYS